MSKILYKDKYMDYTIVVRLVGDLVITDIDKKHKSRFTPIIFDKGTKGVDLAIRVTTKELNTKELRAFIKEVTTAQKALEYFNKKMYLDGLTEYTF